MRNTKVNYLVRMAILIALSLVMIAITRIPIFAIAPQLEYDMADVPILIGTFMFGPVAGLVLTVIVSILQWLIFSPQSLWVGAVMHIIATGGFVLTAGLIYKKYHTLKGAVIALALGSLVMTAIMIPLNYLMTGFYMVGVDASIVKEAVDSIMLPAVIPFNIIKSFGNSLITFLLYKRIGKLFERIKVKQ